MSDISPVPIAADEKKAEAPKDADADRQEHGKPVDWRTRAFRRNKKRRALRKSEQ